MVASATNSGNSNATRERNTMADRLMGHKVNIIVAVSSEGKVWLALTQCNTDSEVLTMFMSRLAETLTKESPGWRDNSIFLLDGVGASIFF